MAPRPFSLQRRRAFIAHPTAHTGDGWRDDQSRDAEQREQQRDGEDPTETLGFLHSAGTAVPPLSTSRTSASVPARRLPSQR